MAKSHYRAHAGVYTGGLNGCYWVRVLREVPGGVLIENLYNVGKIKVDKVQCTVEKDLLYPLLRGRDVQRWRADPSAHLILAQDPATRTGIPEPEMRRRFPKTYSYLKRFEQQLRQRSSSSVRRLIEKGAFYSMFAVGEYTMAPWKVLWPEVGYEVTAAVYGRRKRVDSLKLGLPAHTLICVALADADEAFFLCALLNSSPARLLLRGYVVLHPSPHVLQHVAVPRFERQNKLHRTLSDLSEVAHQAAAKKRAAKLADVEAEIDEAAAELWGLKERELAAIQRALRSQRGDAGTSEEETPSLLDDAEDA